MTDYRRTIVAHALPFWAEQGFDRPRGRFRERLDWSGAPLDVPHRATVQARQVYVFADAARLGWFAPGAELAERAMAYLIRHFAHDSGGGTSFAFSVDADGAPVSTVRDAYAHAFALFAIASLHRLNGDATLLDLADRTIAFVEAELVDPLHGGLFDALPLADPTKRQNPLMHLLEAYIALEETAPGRGHIDRAARLVALFKRRLFKPEPGILLEYFGPDWSPHPDPSRAGLFEPGHHFEWVWLLDRYGAISGTDQTAWIKTLYRVAVAHGLTRDGLIHDEVDADFVPVKRSHRVWPHTEAIKAAAVRHEAGDPAAAGLAARMQSHLTARFLDRPFVGGWIDHIDETGAPLVDYVPASSLYHLFLAAAETVRLDAPAPATPAIA